HTFARILAQGGSRRTKAATCRIFHAEIREAFLAFADFVNGKNVWVIKAGDCFGFAPKPHQRLMRVQLMSKYTLHRDDSTRVLLARAINNSHAPSPDFLQNFVMTKTPLRVSHVGFP